MEAIFGVIYHFIGGFASGSFYIPYKKVKGWAWESYWIVGGMAHCTTAGRVAYHTRLH
jgi:L-rhamnose-H+ transport protein